MKALSGLTPALSRRLQQQLLAHLPPAAARSLRRTLSLNTTSPHREKTYVRSQSASKSFNPDPITSQAGEKVDDDVDNSVKEIVLDVPKQKDVTNNASDQPKEQSLVYMENSKTNKYIDLSAPQFCTLPRLKRHTSIPPEISSPMNSTVEIEYTPKLSSLSKDYTNSRGSSIRSTPDRSLLSKYLTPERNLPLDESYSSDSGSILSEPSYIAAYGTPAMGIRRHSMRLAGEQPRKRLSRFLRPDFFDTPPEESVYAKHKKEKELETQNILKEIRAKKNKASETSFKSYSETNDDVGNNRKCLSPLSILSVKDRSRSSTPFHPILDNIKESTLDITNKVVEIPIQEKTQNVDKVFTSKDNLSHESRLVRPRSYPIKCQIETTDENSIDLKSQNSEKDFRDGSLPKDSKLVRPKSYPASSPSPEKVYISRNSKKGDTDKEALNNCNKQDIEVSFNISLPKKTKVRVSHNADVSSKINIASQTDVAENLADNPELSENLTVKKYHVNVENSNEIDPKSENGAVLKNSDTVDKMTDNVDTKIKDSKTDKVRLKAESDSSESKKGTTKKKIIRKVSSKSKTDVNIQSTNEPKVATEKKKVTKKIKEKNAEEGTKPAATKKKSMLQSIGQKLEKFTNTKNNSVEKVAEKIIESESLKENTKLARTEREHSVPVNIEPLTESNLIKRAVTLTDVAALDGQNTTPNKTTVSKVLGLFKKFEPKEKHNKQNSESLQSESVDLKTQRGKSEPIEDAFLETVDKPKRPTSLLLNGLGRKNKYSKAASDSAFNMAHEIDEQAVNKKDNKRNSLKLDFSKLPRVKKIVPTNPVIEPQIINFSPDDKDKRETLENNGSIVEGSSITASNTLNRNRSRCKATLSNSEFQAENDVLKAGKNLVSPEMPSHHHYVHRNHETTSPEKEDVVDRIRRKSFYTRFNEKKQRRKSSLVGPGATEYDPVARLHSQPTESPTSPSTYDLSPGFSAASDLSPSTERYRSLIPEMPISTRRFENYGLNDRIDTYRSLDRSDLRKYPHRSYSDYGQPLYGTHRYSKTKSLLDSSDSIEDSSLGNLRGTHKYNRTISMYTPGSYATYRPKRTRNSAIILKESEKEPSPENILDKIRERKKLSCASKNQEIDQPDPLPRSPVSPQGEGDSPECSTKVD